MLQKTAGRKVPRLFVQYRLVGPNAGYSFSFVSCRHFLQPFPIWAANWNASIHQCCWLSTPEHQLPIDRGSMRSWRLFLRTGLRASATYFFTFYEGAARPSHCACLALVNLLFFLLQSATELRAFLSYCVLVPCGPCVCFVCCVRVFHVSAKCRLGFLQHSGLGRNIRAGQV